jgi:hypothetical protein
MRKKVGERMACQSKTVYEKGEIEREPRREGGGDRARERKRATSARKGERAFARERVGGKEELASQAGIIVSRDSSKHD